MSSEVPILGIDRGNIALEEQKLEPYLDNSEITNYLLDFISMINREQPNLPNFCRQMGEQLNIRFSNVYAFGSAVTYDIIPQEKKQLEVNTDIIEAARQSLRDAIIYVNGNVYLDDRWLYEKLHSDSPDLQKWLRKETNGMAKDTRKDFTAGAAVILLPVYMMNESANLQARFFSSEK